MVQKKKRKQHSADLRKLNKPGNWLTIEELQAFVGKKFGRHWSQPYIYGLIKDDRLPSYKVGRIFLCEDVESLVADFKRPAPPRLKKVK